MNAVIYARYSSHNQREESIEDQLRVCHEYADRKGYNITHEYTDAAISGKTTEKRPGYLRMIDDAKDGKFDNLILYKMDRFGRSTIDILLGVAQLNGFGVTVMSVIEHIDGDTPEANLMKGIHAVIAQYHSDNLGEGVRRGMHGNALKCKANGVHVFGYRVSKDGYYEPDPITAPYVREMFDMRLKGHTLTEIADWLNSKGIKSIRNNTWNCNRVALILKQEKYIGRYNFGEVCKEDGLPALVEKDVFYMVDGIKARKKDAPRPSALAGKLLCGCGRNMVGTAGTSRNGTVHRYFACNGGMKGKHDCDAKRIPVIELEDYVFEKTVEFFEDEVTLGELLDALEAYAETEVDHYRVDALKAAKRDNERRKKNLLMFLEEGSDADVRERLDELRVEHATLTAEIADELILREPPSRELMQFFIEDLLGDGSTERSKKERILSDFVARVEVSEQHIAIEYNYRTGSGTLASAKMPGFAQRVSGAR